MEFLGIKIDNVTLEEAQLKVRDFLVLPGQFKIFTPNLPAMVNFDPGSSPATT